MYWFPVARNDRAIQIVNRPPAAEELEKFVEEVTLAFVTWRDENAVESDSKPGYFYFSGDYYRELFSNKELFTEFKKNYGASSK